MRWLVFAALLGGCGGSAGEDSGTTTTTGETVNAADEALVRGLIAGGEALDDVLQRVAWSGGWPVHTTSGTWIFLAVGEGPWAVAGDHDGWDGAPMTEGDGFWWAEIEIPDPAGSGYKLSGPDGLVPDPWARSYTWDAYGQLSFVRPPADRARLDRWPALEAEALLPRTVRVYVPPGDGPWPVLYAHDGQNLFSPEAFDGGWRMGEALETRPPMLVVGIDNTADRFDEYTHVTDTLAGTPYGGRADAYARLVGEHLRPHVESTYGSTGADGLLGSSLGGLVSLVIGDLQPGEWDFVASMSGTLGWGRLELDNETIGERWADRTPDGTVLYLDSGGGPGADGLCVDVDGDGSTADDPDATDNYCETRAFADARASAGWEWDVDLFHWHEPGAPHNEAAWAARVGQALDAFPR